MMNTGPHFGPHRLHLFIAITMSACYYQLVFVVICCLSLSPASSTQATTPACQSNRIKSHGGNHAGDGLNDYARAPFDMASSVPRHTLIRDAAAVADDSKHSRNDINQSLTGSARTQTVPTTLNTSLRDSPSDSPDRIASPGRPATFHRHPSNETQAHVQHDLPPPHVTTGQAEKPSTETVNQSPTVKQRSTRNLYAQKPAWKKPPGANNGGKHGGQKMKGHVRSGGAICDYGKGR